MNEAQAAAIVETRKIPVQDGQVLEVGMTQAFISKLRQHFGLLETQPLEDDHVRMFVWGSVNSAITKAETLKCSGCMRTLHAMSRPGILRHTLACKGLRSTSKFDRWTKAVAIAYDTRLADKVWLERAYLVDKRSVVDLANSLCCGQHMVYRALERHEIPKRSRSDVRKLAQPQIEATCLDVHGVKSVFQRPDVMDKITQSFLRDGNGRRISMLNRRAYDVLRARNIMFEPEFTLQADGRTWAFDLRINNLLIELNGDFWHANPNRYSADDMIERPRQPLKKASDIWSQDARKRSVAENLGFRVVTLWESDLKHDFENVLLGAIA